MLFSPQAHVPCPLTGYGTGTNRQAVRSPRHRPACFARLHGLPARPQGKLSERPRGGTVLPVGLGGGGAVCIVCEVG